MFFRLTPVVKNLVIINVLLLIIKAFVPLTILGYSINDLLALHYVGSEDFKLFQFVTHMFMHADFMHLLSNMIGLIVFGPNLEMVWGPKRFLIFYFVTGLGAAVCQMTAHYFDVASTLKILDDFLADPSLGVFQTLLDTNAFKINTTAIFQIQEEIDQLAAVNQQNALNQAIHYAEEIRFFVINSYQMVGASGAVLGIAMGFALYFPNTELILFPIPIPIKAKYLVMGYGVLEIYSAWANLPGDTVAHFAHLGGMVFGYFLIRYWNTKRTRFY